MKQQALYSLAFAALAFAGCKGDYDDWAAPQGYDQEEAVTLAISATAAEAIDMANVETDSVQLFQGSASVSEGTALSDVTVKLDNSQTLSADFATGQVSTSELQTAVATLYGRRPEQRTMDLVINATATNSEGSFLVVSDTIQVQVTLEAPEISEAYYVIGGAVDWTSTAARTQQFTHSGEDVYDDPVFTIVIPAASSSDTWFAIADDKALEGVDGSDWQYVFGTTSGNGNSGNSGSLARRSDLTDEGSFKVDAGTGAYIRIEINMMDYTYTIDPLDFSEFYYEIGNESGWSVNHALRGENYDGSYVGWYYLNGEFKFKPNADNWDGDLEYESEGRVSDNGGSNCPDPGAGFYQINLNTAEGTYSLTQISTIGVIGEFNNWGGDEALTYDSASGTWKGTVTLSGQFKFRANGGWDINWGGDATNLTVGGDNLSATAGTYDIELSLSYPGACTVTITQQ